jgi:RNA polymerase sigma-70 factor, ECF subfamily
LLRAIRQVGVLRLAARARRMRLPMTVATTEEVWQEMRAPLLRFIARRVSDPGDAEDVLQDVMLRIQRHAGEMDELEHLGAWVQQVARSAVVDFYRRRAARREQPAGAGGDLGELPASLGPAPHDATGAELAHCLRPLVARLPDKYRDALEWTAFQGVSQAAAAEQLGLSPSGMKARVQRGRSQLRDLLLECCDVELDRRGGVAGYEVRPGGCARCDVTQSQPV